MQVANIFDGLCNLITLKSLNQNKYKKACNKTTKTYNSFRGQGIKPFPSSLSRMDTLLQGPEWQVVSTDLRISSSKEPSQALLEYLISTLLRSNWLCLIQATTIFIGKILGLTLMFCVAVYSLWALRANYPFKSSFHHPSTFVSPFWACLDSSSISVFLHGYARFFPLAR